MSTAARAQAGRNRAREARLRTARARRQQLDPDRLARETRIDEAAVDVELAWHARAKAQRAVDAAESVAAAAIKTLLTERLSLDDVAKLTGLDQTNLRRLRKIT